MYLYTEGSFWIVSESGQKFCALQANKNVRLAIHDDVSFTTLADLQVTGTAEVLESFGSEYARACELRGIPMERLRAMPFVMNIIKVSPTRFDYIDGTLKQRGFSPRQHIQLLRSSSSSLSWASHTYATMHQLYPNTLRSK